LSDLKDQALKASAENDREFYDGYVDPEATGTGDRCRGEVEAAASAVRRKRLSLGGRVRLPSADRLQRSPRETWSHRCIEAVTMQRPI